VLKNFLISLTKLKHSLTIISDHPTTDSGRLSFTHWQNRNNRAGEFRIPTFLLFLQLKSTGRPDSMNMFQPDVSVHHISQLINQEKPRLLSFIRKKINDHSYSEDIYQEALERTLKRSIQGFVLNDPISYIYKIANNIINDYYQKKVSEDTVCIDDQEVHCEKPQPDRNAEMNQKIEHFLLCLNQLPPETANLLVMRKVHGLTISEIARRVGKEPKSVEKRINRAMRSVLEQIERGVPAVSKRTWF